VGDDNEIFLVAREQVTGYLLPYRKGLLGVSNMQQVYFGFVLAMGLGP
jgi:hypothetical protein